MVPAREDFSSRFIFAQRARAKAPGHRPKGMNRPVPALEPLAPPLGHVLRRSELTKLLCLHGESVKCDPAISARLTLPGVHGAAAPRSADCVLRPMPGEALAADPRDSRSRDPGRP